MTAREEVLQLTERVIAAFAKGDLAPFAAALDDDLEVFDHVAYRFEDKTSFLGYLQSSTGGTESFTFAFHQPTCRTFNDDAAVVNAYDHAMTVPTWFTSRKARTGRSSAPTFPGCQTQVRVFL
jgi:hypothetical protein